MKFIIVLLPLVIAGLHSFERISTRPVGVPCTLSGWDVSSTGGLLQVRAYQDAGDEMNQALRDLYSTKDRVRSKSGEKFRAMAKRSPAARNQVIRALSKVLDDPKANFLTRYDAAEILGELNPAEAVDTLIQHLDINNGTVGLSLSHFPALKAVVAVGKPAVPKLARALLDSKPSIRGYAALALGVIKGSQAKKALERALETEKDEEVIRHIQ